MTLIPAEYSTEEKEVRLTQQDIDTIINQLMYAEHNIFVFLNYDKIIEKLKGEKNRNI